MGYPVRWVRDPSHHDDYKKQYYKKGQWHDKKEHKIKWRDIARQAATPDAEPMVYDGGGGVAHLSPDFAPLRAVFKLAARRLFEILNYRDYRRVVTETAKEDQELRAIWKDVTMIILKYAIDAVPQPPGTPPILRDLLNIFADKFYDFMFSIEL